MSGRRVAALTTLAAALTTAAIHRTDRAPRRVHGEGAALAR
jgi:hypothetical protein